MGEGARGDSEFMLDSKLPKPLTGIIRNLNDQTDDMAMNLRMN